MCSHKKVIQLDVETKHSQLQSGVRRGPDLRLVSLSLWERRRARAPRAARASSAAYVSNMFNVETGGVWVLGQHS